MKNLAFALCLTALSAHAEDLPKEFYYNHEGAEIVLLPDDCDKSDKSQGWQAYAVSDKGDKAVGCWRRGTETVQIWLEIRPHEFLDFEFYQNKFQPRY